MIFDHTFESAKAFLIDVLIELLEVREIRSNQSFTADTALEILHFAENLVLTVEVSLNLIFSGCLQLYKITADIILELLVEFILVVEEMSISRVIEL